MSEKRKLDETDAEQQGQQKKQKLDPELAAKVKQQVEFYFSDSNYPRDKFLRAQAAQNEEGYISVDTLMTFKRLKSLTEDRDAVIEAIRDSSVVKLTDDEKMLKRSAPLPESDTMKERSLYTEGWPEGIKFEDIIQTFQAFGTVLSVRLIKDKEKNFKGAAYVEFSTTEEQQKALAATVQYQGKDITKMAKAEYLKQEGGGKKEKKEKKPKAEGQGGKAEETEKKEVEEEYPKGTILFLDPVGENVSREILKEEFGKFGTIAFVDFAIQQTSAHIRFQQAEEATKALNEFKGELGGKTPTLKILQGEEEKQYWDKVKASQNEKKGEKKGGRGSKRGGRGGRGRGRGRGRK